MSTPASPPPVEGLPPEPPQPSQQPDPAVQRLEAELAKTQEGLSRVTQALNNIPAASTPAPAPVDAVPTKRDVEKQLWADPLPTIDAMATRRAIEVSQSIQGGSLETLAVIARDKVRGDGINAEIFDKYAGEIYQLVNQMQPQFRANINVWQNAFNMVRGNHMTEILEMQAQRGRQQQALVGDGPASPTPRAPAAPPKVVLSDDEKRVAKGFGLTEDEYRRGKERVNDQEKSWNENLTFDSLDKRRRDAARKPAAK